MSERLDVRTVAQGRWMSILAALGMDERALSGKHTACPMCGGKDRFRFDDREGRGTYICSGCGAGDGVQLAMSVTGLAFRNVAREIERIAGSVMVGPVKFERTDDDKLAALRRVFVESKLIEKDDEADRYLARRGLSIHDLPDSIRTHPALQYHEAGKMVAVFPAMLGVITGPTGKAVGIHRTYLQDGQKAPVPAPKKLMAGLPIAGAAIRLTPVSRTLGIAEGIETALACFEQFEVPTWSCISASGIESFEPPECVEHIVIFADNDANYAGQSAAFRVAHRLRIKGYEVEVHVPPEPGDWLDVLNQQSATSTSHRETFPD